MPMIIVNLLVVYSWGGGALPSNGLLGMCCWMGSHFQDATNYKGFAFSDIFNRVSRLGFHILGDFESRKIICPEMTKMGSITGNQIDQK